VFPGCGVNAGPDDEDPSSVKMRPIVLSGFWRERSNPATATFSSPPSGASVLSLDDTAILGWSADRRGFGGGEGGEGGGGRSAIAATAASTFASNSSGVMVRDERSRFSINWIAPILKLRQRGIHSRRERWTYQGTKIVSRLTRQLVGISKSQNILHIADQMFWVRSEDDKDQERYKLVRALIAFTVS
jgi:hypothetical protein